MSASLMRALRRCKNPRLDSPHGASLAAFLILLMPLFLLILATSVDGLMLVAAQRRAQSMAAIGVQTGAASLSFDGGAPTLSGEACALAVKSACDNVEGGCRSGLATVSCRQSSRALTVNVRLRAPHLLRGLFRLTADEARVSVEGGPAYGINTRE